MGGNTLNTMPPEEANLLWAELFKDSSQFWFGRKHSMVSIKTFSPYYLIWVLAHFTFNAFCIHREILNLQNSDIKKPARFYV